MLSSQLYKSSTKLTSLLTWKTVPKTQPLQHKTPSNFKKLLGALGATPSGCTKKCSHWKFNKTQPLQHKIPSTFKKLLGALGATPSGCTKKCSHWKFNKT